MFAATDRLRSYVLSGELEDAEAEFLQVVVLTKVEFVSFAYAWQRAVPPDDESVMADDDESFGIWGPAPTSRGAAFALQKFGTPIVCVERFLDLLNRTGLDGDLDHFHESESPRYGEQVIAKLDLDGEPYVYLRGDRLALEPGSPHDLVRGWPGWKVPDANLQQIIDFVCAWCFHDATAQLYLSSDLISFRVVPDDLAGLVRDATRPRELPRPVSVVAQTASHSRWVELHHEAGVVTFAIKGWPLTGALRDEGLAELTRVLVATADWSTYGRIRRAGPYFNLINDLEYGHSWPAPAANAIPPSHPLRLVTERGAVPDAFGIQLLGPRLAAAGLPSGGNWLATRLNTGHVLLEQRDRDAWFASAQPDPVRLDAARRDLAGLIRGQATNATGSRADAEEQTDR